MTSRLQITVAAINTVGRVAATILLLGMMSVTMVDVVGRKLGFSIVAAFELTQLLVALAFYLVLPMATAIRAHITVDLLPVRQDKGAGLVTSVLVDLLSAFAMGWVAAMLFNQAATLSRFNTNLMFLGWPLSPFVLLMAIFASVTSLICLIQAAQRVSSAIGGRRP
jgi:TRAP-type C4-dicarboxylate transport system permease small subunit